MKDNFKTGVEYQNDIKRNVYRGLSLMPLQDEIITKLDKDKTYQQFILEKCEIGYKNRISYSDFFTNYEKWMQEKNGCSDFAVDIKIRREIQKFLENTFAAGRVHLSDTKCSTHLHGIWGLALKEQNGVKEKKLTRKAVSEICIKTGKEINRWNSLSIACENLDIPKSTLSTYIRFNRVVGNVIYRYIQ